jgi:DNA-binding transcriptional MerR regulator
MGNLMPIGRFSQICRLSIKTLRHYDEVDLLKPAHIDPWTNYRYYALEQAAIAEQIRLLRATEMPIEDIRIFLNEADVVRRDTILTDHYQRLQQRIAEHQNALALLKRLQQRKERVMIYDIRIQEVKQYPVAAIGMAIPWGQFDKVVGPGFQEIVNHLGGIGATITGTPLLLYRWPDATTTGEGAEGELEIAIPVATPILESDRVKNQVVPGGVVACTTHVGPYDEISGAFQAIQAWLQEFGHESAGICWEVYVTDPQSTPDPADYRTDVYWLLR